MGYFVFLQDADFRIASKNFNSCLSAMNKLNDYDAIKRGGCLGADEVRPDGFNYNPNKWFSWLDPNYPEKAKTLRELFWELGFDFSLEDGDYLKITGYDNKMGQESLFFDVIAPWVEPGSYIDWIGEDKDSWRWSFDGEKMLIKDKHEDGSYSDGYELLGTAWQYSTTHGYDKILEECRQAGYSVLA